MVDNKHIKLLWDMRIQTNKELDHSKPDIVILDKESRLCKIIEVTCPFDTRILEAETEKIGRCQDIKYELERIWSCKEVKVIPIVIGSLGTISKTFESWLTQVSEKIHFGTLQKACLLGTSRILRYVLNS